LTLDYRLPSPLGEEASSLCWSLIPKHMYIAPVAVETILYARRERGRSGRLGRVRGRSRSWKRGILKVVRFTLSV
jgi:hypothetical protein